MFDFCRKFRLFCLYKLVFLFIIIGSFIVFNYFEVFEKNTVVALIYYFALIIINFLITPYIILEEAKRLKKSKKNK